MPPRYFSTDQIVQLSPEWWEMRCGIPTSSDFDKILTPAKMQYSSQAEDYMAQLVAQVLGQNPNCFSENGNRPPNKAIEDGIAREAESRRYLVYERDVTVQQVGFVLAEGGMWGCSPDGLIITDSGSISGTLELKNPQYHTQAKYVMAGGLPREYRCQCHGHIVVTELPCCTFLSYCKPLPEVLLDICPDEFTVALKAALERFSEEYRKVLCRLGLWNRFCDLRSNTLSHYPEEKPHVV